MLDQIFGSLLTWANIISLLRAQSEIILSCKSHPVKTLRKCSKLFINNPVE